ncbi:hypothetical protein KR009_007318, partial [Drosophila setifemur]
NNPMQRSKIFTSLLGGGRLQGKKRTWYPTPSGSKSTRPGGTSGIKFHASRFEMSLAQPSKHNNRRMSVLNKLFMTNITDLLATGTSDSIVGQGMQVSHVNITSDFSHINVYWVAHKDGEASQELEEELHRYSGQLQHELSQLRLMGKVPRIRFVRDKNGMSLNQVQELLAKIDRKGIKEVAEEPCAEFDTKAATPAVVNWPEMRQDVLNLNQRTVMTRINNKMRKFKEAWDNYAREQSHP